MKPLRVRTSNVSLKRPHVKFDIGEKWNRTESVSSTMIKVEIAKDIYLQLRKVFDIRFEKYFVILVWQIKSK